MLLLEVADVVVVDITECVVDDTTVLFLYTQNFFSSISLNFSPGLEGKHWPVLPMATIITKIIPIKDNIAIILIMCVRTTIVVTIGTVLDSD